MMAQYDRENMSSYYKKNLKYKLKNLKSSVAMIKNTGTTEINIRRNFIFQDAYDAIMKKTVYELKKNFKIKYTGEEGVDAGGLISDFFFNISKELTNPKYSLFTCSNESSYNLRIDPSSRILKPYEYFHYYKFVGRLMGMAIFHNQYLAVSFIIPIYKLLLNKELELNDLKDVDPSLYSNLKWILEHYISINDGYTFSRNITILGKVKTIELIPNGSKIYVNNSNKEKYIKLMVESIINYDIEKQLDGIKQGFNEIIPNDLLSNFNEHDLDLLISGIRKINVEDWKNNTLYEGYNKSDMTISYFWMCVDEFDDNMRSKLLQFVTGNSQVPVTGFKDLQGSDGIRLFKINYDRDERNLPRTHTCFNSIDLPPYSSYEKLKQKLTLAINESQSFQLR